MRGEPRVAELRHPRRTAAREKHVRDGDGIFVLEPRARRVRRHHDERALQRLRISRELDRRRISEVLATTRDRSLQKSSGERASTAGYEDAHRNEADAARALTVAALAHDASCEIGDDAEAEDPRGHTHVDLHIAVEDVTEFVADHGLKLVAVELVERA